jgi:hypothetical protein
LICLKGKEEIKLGFEFMQPGEWGRVHYTSNEIWFQPSAYIDEKISKEWQPIIVESTSSKESVLDITEKTNTKRDSLSINKKDAQYTFPRYLYTVITLKKQ